MVADLIIFSLCLNVSFQLEQCSMHVNKFIMRFHFSPLSVLMISVIIWKKLWKAFKNYEFIWATHLIFFSFLLISSSVFLKIACNIESKKKKRKIELKNKKKSINKLYIKLDQHSESQFLEIYMYIWIWWGKMKTNEIMYKKYQFQISYHGSLTYCFVVELNILTLHLHLRGVSQNFQRRRVSLRLICTCNWLR